ncbi:hypothetical protein ACOSQ4_002099 [Xanthoceras sorbifolium]
MHLNRYIKRKRKPNLISHNSLVPHLTSATLTKPFSHKSQQLLFASLLCCFYLVVFVAGRRLLLLVASSSCRIESLLLLLYHRAAWHHCFWLRPRCLLPCRIVVAIALSPHIAADCFLAVPHHIAAIGCFLIDRCDLLLLASFLVAPRLSCRHHHRSPQLLFVKVTLFDFFFCSFFYFLVLLLSLHSDVQ